MRTCNQIINVFLFDGNSEVRKELEKYFSKKVRRKIFRQIKIYKPKNISEIRERIMETSRCFILINTSLYSDKRELLQELIYDYCSSVNIVIINAKIWSKKD